MRLQEILNKYQGYGLSDFEIIQQFFIENHIEDKAVEMLNELSQKRIKRQHEYISTLKEFYSYGNAILCNKNVDFEDRLSLLSLYNFFLSYGELNQEQLGRARKIFEKLNRDNFTACPQVFLAYLQKYDIGKQFGDSSSFECPIIESRGE